MSSDSTYRYFQAEIRQLTRKTVSLEAAIERLKARYHKQSNSTVSRLAELSAKVDLVYSRLVVPPMPQIAIAPKETEKEND